MTADVVHPYDAGATNLYSVEYFSLVARSLSPNGIMIQWVSPGSAFEHSLIVRTFLQAFPNSTLWLGGDLLVGSPSPLRLSRAELDARLADPSARASLAEVGFNHAQDVLAQFRGTAEELHDLRRRRPDPDRRPPHPRVLREPGHPHRPARPEPIQRRPARHRLSPLRARHEQMSTLDRGKPTERGTYRAHRKFDRSKARHSTASEADSLSRGRELLGLTATA